MLQRNTIVSSHLLKILETTNHPLSVTDILRQMLAKSLQPNKTTIYRILKKLIDKNKVSEFSVKNGTTYFELSGSHHHHFICNECHAAFCLTGCHVNLNNMTFDNMLPSNGFQINSHDFNLYGLCDSCVEGEKK
ncbi:hypothetical protein DID76_04080 [Candidatus Marinamargulisbacteria bacterium SCGC AG-414-C22]|nr:hypothetical protein DID76_04080 [Candidatus Marinamargulisbacteria bacterium SCGC AG-414-C22]